MKLQILIRQSYICIPEASLDMRRMAPPTPMFRELKEMAAGDLQWDGILDPQDADEVRRRATTQEPKLRGVGGGYSVYGKVFQRQIQGPK